MKFLKKKCHKAAKCSEEQRLVPGRSILPLAKKIVCRSIYALCSCLRVCSGSGFCFTKKETLGPVRVDHCHLWIHRSGMGSDDTPYSVMRLALWCWFLWKADDWGKLTVDWLNSHNFSFSVASHQRPYSPNWKSLFSTKKFKMCCFVNHTQRRQKRR